MAYQLKDLILQLHLDFMTNGDFSKRLNQTVNDLLNLHKFERLPKTFCVNFGEDLAKGRGECPNFRHSITLFDSEVKEYDE